MKRLNILTWVLGGMVAISSCQPKATQPDQATIDAKVAEKVAEKRNELQAECDQKILDAARMKADSFLVKMANKPAKVVTRNVPTPPKPTTKPKTTPPSPPKAPEPPKNPSNTTRPGSNQGSVPANNTSRPGSDQGAANQKTSPAGNNNRPGANK